MDVQQVIEALIENKELRHSVERGVKHIVKEMAPHLPPGLDADHHPIISKVIAEAAKHIWQAHGK